ncbi:hypothetical protein ISN75_14155 [Dyella marensis]|uniref:hypothetical protein n=1 Tax=Dyella marensis TaxID=500610 RepID=UPI0031DDBA38
MPRNDTTRIDPRQTIDSSQSANVPLQVRANVDSAGRGGMGWAVAHALNRVAGEMADTQSRAGERQRIRDEEAKNTQDKKDGQAAAAETAVTGVQKTADELEAHGKVFTQAYQESDGLRHRYQFEQDLKPELARLEPGTDINEYIQSKALEYVQNNEMPEESRKSFMTAVAKAQPEWKIDYAKHSITESLKRDEENHQAILVGEMTKAQALTPEMLQQWQQQADLSGLHDYERDDITAKAAIAALSSGKVNIDQTLKTLDGQFGAGGRVLHDIYREQIDTAAKQGRSLQEKEQREAQEGQLTKSLFYLNDKADVGGLGDKEIELYRARFKMSPEWAATLHNRNREAQQKAAEKTKKDQDDAALRMAYLNGDPIHVEQLGASKVNAAGEKALQDSLASSIASKDFTGSKQFLLAAARNNAKSDGFQRITTGLADTANPARFEMGYQLYKMSQNVAPGWTEANMEPKTLAAYQMYDRQVSLYHANPQQALAAATAAKEVSPEVLAEQRNQVKKKLDSKLPKDFEDSAWLSLSPHGSTKVANPGYVETAVLQYATDAINNGQFHGDPNGAIEHAMTLFKANHVQVGDRYEPTFGTAYTADQAKTVGEAMTALGREKKAQLVKDKIVDPEDTVGFAPSPNAPNKWLLFSMHGNVRMPLTEEVTVTDPATGKHTKEARLVEVVASDTASKFGAWKKQEAERDIVTRQGIKQFGLDFGTTEDKLKHLDEIPRGAVDNYMHGWNEVSLPQGLRTPEQRTKARAFLTAPERASQSFTDFINSTK